MLHQKQWRQCAAVAAAPSNSSCADQLRMRRSDQSDIGGHKEFKNTLPKRPKDKLNVHILEVELHELPPHGLHPGLPPAPPDVHHCNLHLGRLGVRELAEVRCLVPPSLREAFKINLMAQI